MQNELRELEDYARRVGLFWVQFNSLELLLRLYLSKAAGDPEGGLGYAEGDSCAVTHLTNYDGFPKLAAKFNAHVGKTDALGFARIERVRDALAHGRAVGAAPRLPLTMTKFSKPFGSPPRVRVEFKQELSVEFLDEIARDVSRAVALVAKRLSDDFPGTVGSRTVRGSDVCSLR